MYLYGASGHGKVIKEILESNGIRVDGFVDDNLEKQEYAGLPVYHSTEDVDDLIVSIGYNEIRKEIAEKADCHFADAACHVKAVISETARIGDGTVVMAGVVINADAQIGRHCIINTCALVDHECVIDDYVHIAPKAALCGHVEVGEGTLIGVGASVAQCRKIGKWCTIGAGAVVVKDIPDGAIVVGVPGKVIGYKDKVK